MTIHVVVYDQSVNGEIDPKYQILREAFETKELAAVAASNLLGYAVEKGKSIGVIDTTQPINDLSRLAEGDAILYRYDGDLAPSLSIAHAVFLDSINPCVKIWRGAKYGQMEGRFIAPKRIECFYKLETFLDVPL